MASPLLLSSLSKYFSEHPREAQLLKPLVDGTYPVSLRVIDWFVTHYSKLKNVLYWIDDEHHTLLEGVPVKFEPHIRKFHLYYEYRAQLKSYTKLFFDPFRRHDRISFIVQTKPELQTIETTTGQLNFFRWAIQNHLLEYIQRHLSDIEETMTQHQGQRKKVTKQKNTNLFTNTNTNMVTSATAVVEPKKTSSSGGGGGRRKSVQVHLSQQQTKARDYRIRFD